MKFKIARLNKKFEVVVTHKNKKTPFLKACENLNVKPQECLFVGDWPERDIVGAKGVGMKTAWAKYGSCGECDFSDCSLNCINDLLGEVGV